MSEGGDIGESFKQLFRKLSVAWPKSEIYVLPILNKKDIDSNTVTNFNNVELAIGVAFPHIHILESFEMKDFMYHDGVHLSDKRGLPPLVKHIKSEMKITNYKTLRRYIDSDSNNQSKQVCTATVSYEI